MTDREKMIELVYGAHNAVTDKAIENHSTFGMSYSEQIETEADYLLANGVTFATDKNVGSILETQRKKIVLLEKSNRNWRRKYQRLKKRIAEDTNVPSKAHWIIRSSGKGDETTNWAECSNCLTCGSPQWKVCPVCEARMVE